MNTGWWEIDIHGCYSLVKIAFAPICACKNNRQMWRHNASISCSRDVTDPLWWRSLCISQTLFHCFDQALQWRHNERNDVSNHWCIDCLLKRLFRRRSKKPSKLRVSGLCEGNLPVTGEFPAQTASNAENVSISWHHHEGGDGVCLPTNMINAEFLLVDEPFQ